MGRRFRLKQCKNEERKKKALLFSFPRESLVVGMPHGTLLSSPLPTPSEEIHITPSLLVSLPISSFSSGPVLSSAQLGMRLSKVPLPPPWVLTSSSPLVLCNVMSQSTHAAIAMSVHINSECDWSVTVLKKQFSHSDSVMSAFPVEKLKTVADVHQLFQYLDCTKFCIGNPDPMLIDKWKRQQSMAAQHGSTSGCIDDSLLFLKVPTLRHHNCHILLDPENVSVRCSCCSTFRSILQTSIWKEKLKISNGSINSEKVNYRFLSMRELTDRLHRLQQRYRTLQKSAERLKEKVMKATEEHGITLDEESESYVAEIMTSQDTISHMENLSSKQSIRHIFWQQQLEASSKTHLRGMRWHPLMIRWCLYLRHKSSAAYEALQESGCIVLPSQRTLRDYTHYVQSSFGFSAETDQMLTTAAKVSSCPERERSVMLLIDEVHIKENLVYDKHSHNIIGFANLGDINEHLTEFELSLTSEQPTNTQKLAKTIVVFMVRGLFNKLQFPYVQFPCHSLSGHQLYDPFWEAVGRLEQCGLKVHGVTMDGGAPNRSLIKLHQPCCAGSFVYKVPNPYSVDNRFLYFVSDPPHLVKTMRNCFMTRRLWCNEKDILWSHVQKLYEADTTSMCGIRLLPKLRYEHISLTSFSKMRVDLAAQVLSESVSKAVVLVCGDVATETAKFLDMADKLFDTLNVHNYSHGATARKPFQMPFTSHEDWRLKWLENDFLKYLDNWESSVSTRPGFSKAQRQTMMLSAATRYGLRMTVWSFIELVQYIFSIPDVHSFLSQRLCQDPLERFFGCQRQRGRIHDNPNAAEFLKNTQALRVINSFSHCPNKGNCRGGNVEIDEATCEPLPKRRCRSKHNAVTSDKNQSVVDLGSCNDSILMKALHHVVNEEAHSISYFQEKSPKQISQGLAEWIHEHPDSASAFEKAIVESFLNCIPFTSTSPHKKKTRTEMWGKYHTLRTSIAYVEDWKLFLRTSQLSYNPIFCQSVGHFIFKDLVKAKLAVHSSDSTLTNVTELTYEEINALRYTAGYVPRALKKKLLRSSLPNKKDLELCLDDLISDGDETLNHTSDWLTSINRGGLIIVSDMAFELFLAMEKELRNHLQYHATCINAEAVSTIVNSEDVLFPWSIVTATWEQDNSNILLGMIVDMWITIRGFSLASAWMEIYKKQEKKLTQKSKGLRKQLL